MLYAAYEAQRVALDGARAASRAAPRRSGHAAIRADRPRACPAAAGGAPGLRRQRRDAPPGSRSAIDEVTVGTPEGPPPRRPPAPRPAGRRHRGGRRPHARSARCCASARTLPTARRSRGCCWSRRCRAISPRCCATPSAPCCPTTTSTSPTGTTPATSPLADGPLRPRRICRPRHRVPAARSARARTWSPSASPASRCWPAVALMAEDDHPAQPPSMTLMAGPVDTPDQPDPGQRAGHGTAASSGSSENLISAVPGRYAGAGGGSIRASCSSPPSCR